MNRAFRIGIVMYVLALAVVLAKATQAASVGPTGYTNDFSSRPLAADWSTLAIPGDASTFGTLLGLQAAVQTNASDRIITAVELTTGTGANPPTAQALATWSSDGQFIQTRPSGVAATLLMVTLLNNSGVDQSLVDVTFNFSTKNPVTEELPYLYAFYSLSGAPGSWETVPEFSLQTNSLMSAAVVLNGTWSNGNALHLLFADDNADGATDTALQLDNFSMRFGAALNPAVVGSNGYTNAFDSASSLEGWFTRPILNESGADLANVADLDAAVTTNSASLIATRPSITARSLPDASGMAFWSTSGFLQTRPTLVATTLLVSKLLNNTGADATHVALAYDFHLRAGREEQINGHRVFFSHTGLPNSWINLPSLTATNEGRYSTNFNVGVWPNGATLYLLWADDNGLGSPDAAYQIDNFSIQLTSSNACLPVGIQLQPSSQCSALGATATFSVSATGTVALAYQWRFDTVPLPDATNASFTISNVQANHAGRYDVIIMNACGAVTSLPANLRVGINGFVWNDLNADALWQRQLVRGTNIVIVVDNSSSTRQPFGGTPVGDVNLDGQSNTILDAELAALIALNDGLVSQGFGSTVRVAVVPFAADAASLDLNPLLPGRQIGAAPSADENNDGVRDVEQGLRSIIHSSGTDYHNALLEARDALIALGGATGDGSILFLSDGEPNSVPYAQDVADLQTAGVHLRAFGAGTNASLAPLLVIDPAAHLFKTSDELVDFFNIPNLYRAGEPGMPQVTVYVDLDDSGTWEPVEPAVLTLEDDPGTPLINESGGYGFPCLPAGTYTVRQMVPPGYRQTFPPCGKPHVVTIDAGGSASGLKFGNTSITNPLTPASLEITVQGGGVATVKPPRMSYSVCETVTLEAAPSCTWAFGYWTDGITRYPKNPLPVTLGLENSYTAVFTNLVTNCGGDGITIWVNEQTGDNLLVTNNASVCLKTTLTNVVLRYTTDCVEPSLASPVFTNCFNVFYAGKFPELYTNVIRAAAFDSNGVMVAQQACPVTIVLTNECPDYYRLFATVRGSGGGLLAGGTVSFGPVKDPYPCGTVIELEAIPAEGWEFMGWLGDAGGSGAQTSVIMTEGRCVEAVFGTSLTTSEIGGGIVHRIPGTQKLAYNTPVRLVAEPAPGNYFVEWNGSASGTNAILNFNVNAANPSIIARFAPLATLPSTRFSLSTRLHGRGTVGTRPYRNHYGPGVLVTNTALPDAGQQFLGWGGDTNGMAMINPNTIYFPMSASRVVTASFTRGPRIDFVQCQGEFSKEGVDLKISGDPEVQYGIQATSKLVSPPSEIQWTSLGTVSNSIGTATFLDRTSLNHTQRFYRVVLPPFPE